MNSKMPNNSPQSAQQVDSPPFSGIPAVPASAPPLTKHRGPLLPLTGVRFFAASYVIILHTRAGAVLTNHGFVHLGRFLENGYLAVPLFFMLSGFILAYNYRNQIQARSDAFRFWEARFARIWPAYLFSLLCSSFPVSNIPSPPLAFATIFMVQAWNPFHPEYAGVWNFVCWTLSVEAFFYLVFPLLQKFTEKLQLRALKLFGLFIAFVGVALNTPSHTLVTASVGMWTYIPAPLIHLPEFIAGVILGNLFLVTRRQTPSLASKTISAPSESVSASVPRKTRISGRTISWRTWLGVLLCAVILSTALNNWEGLVIPGFGLLLYGLVTEQTFLSWFLSTRALVLGGEISYSMYLLRTPLQKWIGMVPGLHESLLVGVLYIPLVLIPFSIATFYFVEAPARRLLRRMFASIQARA
jgi:peptidoglycan/LPS O-acetylase OafA/YrhL